MLVHFISLGTKVSIISRKSGRADRGIIFLAGKVAEREFAA
jgi:hypothetical protein